MAISTFDDSGQFKYTQVAKTTTTLVALIVQLIHLGPTVPDSDSDYDHLHGWKIAILSIHFIVDAYTLHAMTSWRVAQAISRGAGAAAGTGTAHRYTSVAVYPQ